MAKKDYELRGPVGRRIVWSIPLKKEIGHENASGSWTGITDDPNEAEVTAPSPGALRRMQRDISKRLP